MPFNATDKTLLEVQDNEWGVTLVQGYMNREGVFKAEFCKKKNYTTREIEDLRPLSVYLGKTKKKAIEAARYILSVLEGSGDTCAGDDNDIPF